MGIVEKYLKGSDFSKGKSQKKPINVDEWLANESKKSQALIVEAAIAKEREVYRPEVEEEVIPAPPVTPKPIKVVLPAEIKKIQNPLLDKFDMIIVWHPLVALEEASDKH